MADTLVIPDTAEALEDFLNDPAKMGQLASDPSGFIEFNAKYTRAFMAADPQFQDMVKAEASKSIKAVVDGDVSAGITRDAAEAVQRELAHQLRNAEAGKRVNRLNLADSRARALNGPLGGPGWGARNALFNEHAPGAKLEDMFDGMADYLRTIWHKSNMLPGNRAERAAKIEKLTQIQNDYGSTVPADGGFLIPETLRSEVMMIALEQGVTRSRARVIPMETLSVPIPAVDSTSNVSSVFGGIVCYWTEEGAPLTESQALFRRVVLTAKKLTAYAEIPNELVQDATAFGGFFNQVYPQAMAWYEDDAFVNGTGVGEPFGWLRATAAVEVAKESGQPAASIVWENIAKMYARMLPSSLGSAVWVASIDTFPELATMALSVGTGGSAIWLNNGAVGPPVTILGRPVVFTEKTSLLGAAGDLNFVDLGYYLIGDRQVMQAESSSHFKFGNDLTAFRFIERVDGRPWLESAITPKNGGSTLSPFVKIAVRA